MQVCLLSASGGELFREGETAIERHHTHHPCPTIPHQVELRLLLARHRGKGMPCWSFQLHGISPFQLYGILLLNLHYFPSCLVQALRKGSGLSYPPKNLTKLIMKQTFPSKMGQSALGIFSTPDTLSLKPSAQIGNLPDFWTSYAKPFLWEHVIFS